jgi:hypothetical protein
MLRLRYYSNKIKEDWSVYFKDRDAHAVHSARNTTMPSA